MRFMQWETKFLEFKGILNSLKILRWSYLTLASNMLCRFVCTPINLISSSMYIQMPNLSIDHFYYCIGWTSHHYSFHCYILKHLQAEILEQGVLSFKQGRSDHKIFKQLCKSFLKDTHHKPCYWHNYMSLWRKNCVHIEKDFQSLCHIS